MLNASFGDKQIAYFCFDLVVMVHIKLQLVLSCPDFAQIFDSWMVCEKNELFCLRNTRLWTQLHLRWKETQNTILSRLICTLRIDLKGTL